MPLQATSGAASYDAFGGGVPAEPNYIESCFSTWLYTGNGSTQTITNGIDLAGKGGLVWIKSRSNATENLLYDTVRGAYNYLISSTTGAQVNNSPTGLSSFDSTGFNVAGTTIGGGVNGSGATYASWTFREAPKFFDVQTISHTNGTATNISLTDLGTVGTVIAKITSNTGDWITWHRSLTAGNNLRLNTTAAQTTTNAWLSVSGTTATLASAAPTGTYVIYSYAHDAGGFGLTGTDNVISCGSFTASSGAATVDLGYEPQWILFKRTNGAEGWNLVDNMRGWSYSATALLQANTSSAEDPNGLIANPTATGFQFGTGTLAASGAYIYIAIRRGPMKTPTTGTSVFAPVAWAGNTTSLSTDRLITGTSFPVDLAIINDRSSPGNGPGAFMDRLRGAAVRVRSFESAAEANFQEPYSLAQQDGVLLGDYDYNYTGRNYVGHFLRRAPGFFDEVCYTGTGSARTVAHNLAVVPELMIVKQRTDTNSWQVYSAALGNTSRLVLNLTDGTLSATIWNDTTPTSTVFSVSGNAAVNGSGNTYAAYLFASCPGVSKVGSYTGNGSSQTIDCGFTGGARFVMIKRTNSTGDWYVWDTARGIVSGNDPHLSLNTTAAEVTSNDTIDTDSTGFVVNQVSATNVNVSSATYIFLAIA
jgi:hypothetical protein